MVLDPGNMAVTVSTSKAGSDDQNDETVLGQVSVKPLMRAEFPETTATLKIHLNNVDTI